MRIKATATVAVKFYIDPADYVDDETGVAKTEDEIIAYELKLAKEGSRDSLLIDQLCGWDAEASDLKIEKVPESAEVP